MTLPRSASWLALAIAATGCVRSTPTQPVAPTSAVQAPAAQRFASPYTYEWFVRAELLRGAGQLGAAIEAYRSALAGADEDAPLLARLATALDEQGSHAEAERVVADALEVDPYSEAAWLARAEIAERSGDLALAFEALDRAEQAEPRSRRAPLMLAALLRAHGDPERAQAVLLRYEARTLPGSRGAYQARLTRNITHADAAGIFAATLPYRIAAEPPQNALLLEAARALLAQGHAAEALRLLDLVPRDQGDPALRLRALASVGPLAELEGWLATHESLQPDERLIAARAYLLLAKPEAAAASVEADRVARVGDPALQLLAAEVELSRGAYATAAELFARIPAGTGASAAARVGLSQALSACGLSELGAELQPRAAAQ
jgi:Tfp pilus assembly protein PilF